MTLIDSARKLAVEVQKIGLGSVGRWFPIVMDADDYESLRAASESVLVDCQRAEQREPPHCPTCGCGQPDPLGDALNSGDGSYRP